MKRSLVLTVTGPDRPGLVRAVSQEVADAGGDWLESRMATLAGTFAGVVLVAVPDDRSAALAQRLQALEAKGVRVAIEPGSIEPGAAGPATSAGRVVLLDLVGQDHPGIVRDVSRLLADRQISVEELETHTVSGAFSGETLFKARARLRVPAQLPTPELRSLLEALAHELMVDVSLEALEGDQ